MDRLAEPVVARYRRRTRSLTKLIAQPHAYLKIFDLSDGKPYRLSEKSLDQRLRRPFSAVMGNTSAELLDDRFEPLLRCGVDHCCPSHVAPWAAISLSTPFL